LYEGGRGAAGHGTFERLPSRSEGVVRSLRARRVPDAWPGSLALLSIENVWPRTRNGSSLIENRLSWTRTGAFRVCDEHFWIRNGLPRTRDGTFSLRDKHFWTRVKHFLTRDKHFWTRNRHFWTRNRPLLIEKCSFLLLLLGPWGWNWPGGGGELGSVGACGCGGDYWTGGEGGSSRSAEQQSSRGADQQRRVGGGGYLPSYQLREMAESTLRGTEICIACSMRETMRARLIGSSGWRAGARPGRRRG
jgi:hypothetical protein